MPQCLFYLNKEKQQCFSATWNFNWSNFKLRFQDEVICSLATKKELTAGRQFVMGDGHLLSVRLKGGLQPELELLRDGLPLLVRNTGPRTNQRTVFQLALFLAALNIAVGTVAAVTQSDVLLSIGFGYGSIAIGAAYVLLAWGIRHLISYAAFAIAALICLDMLLLFVFTAVKDGPSSPASGLLIKLFLVYAFLKGVWALRKLRAQTAA